MAFSRVRPPLHGRANEEAAIGKGLAALRDGRGFALLVEGEAGVGRSALLDRAADLAAAHRCTVLRATGGPPEDRQWLDLSQPSAPAPDLASEPHDRQGDEEEDTPALTPAASRTAADGPLVLIVDDLQWCDASSLRLIADLAGRGEREPIGVIAALRAGTASCAGSETATGTGNCVEPAADLLSRVTGRLQRMVLTGLDAQAVAQTVTERLGTVPDPEFTAACHRLTAGNPWLLHELLTEVAARGARPAAATAVRLAEFATPGMTRYLLAPIARRCAMAPAVAEAVAVLGRNADLGLVAELAGVDRAAAADAADALAHRGILHPDQPFGFVHPILGAALTRRLGPAGAGTAHARAARALHDAGKPDTEIAGHLVRAHRLPEPWVTPVLRSAARRAADRGDQRTAVEYLRGAVRHCPPSGPSAELLVELGTALTAVDLPAAIDQLTSALSAAPEARTRARTASALAVGLLLGDAQTEAVRVLDETAGMVAAEDGWLAVGLHAQALSIAPAAAGIALLTAGGIVPMAGAGIAPLSAGGIVPVAGAGIVPITTGGITPLSADAIVPLAVSGGVPATGMPSATAPTGAMTTGTVATGAMPPGAAMPASAGAAPDGTMTTGTAPDGSMTADAAPDGSMTAGTATDAGGMPGNAVPAEVVPAGTTIAGAAMAAGASGKAVTAGTTGTTNAVTAGAVPAGTGPAGSGMPGGSAGPGGSPGTGTGADPRPARTVLACRAIEEVRRGTSADLAEALAVQALSAGPPRGHEEAVPYWGALLTLTRTENLHLASVFTAEADRDAQRRGWPPGSAVAAALRCRIAYLTGRLNHAREYADTAFTLLDSVGANGTQSTWLLNQSMVIPALVESGRLDQAETLLHGTDTSEGPQGQTTVLGLLLAQGLLQIARGEQRTGLNTLVAYGRAVEIVGVRIPCGDPWRAKAALAHYRLGEETEARRLAADGLALAYRWDRPRKLGLALHASGVVTGGRRGLQQLDQAIQLLDRASARLDLAHALADHGIALARGGNAARGRERLRHAARLAAECGAEPLSRRVHDELHAAQHGSRWRVATTKAPGSQPVGPQPTGTRPVGSQAPATKGNGPVPALGAFQAGWPFQGSGPAVNGSAPAGGTIPTGPSHPTDETATTSAPPVNGSTPAGGTIPTGPSHPTDETATTSAPPVNGSTPAGEPVDTGVPIPADEPVVGASGAGSGQVAGGLLSATVHSLMPERAAPSLVIRCFGEFRLEIPGRQLDWSAVRPRVRALLRLLAAYGGRPVHREVIIAALWPELPPQAGIRNLHVGISTLRAFLEPGVGRGGSRFIPRDGESYLLNVLPPGQSDVRAFDEAVASWRRAKGTGRPQVAAGALREALALYTGDLLPEEGPAEWIVAKRDSYRVTAAESAVTLAAIELSAGRFDAAVTAARRGLELDGFRDRAWRVLTEAHQRSGDPAAAAQTRSAYRDLLRSLGVNG